MTDIEILRYAAFSADPAGGNPAGVVLDASSLSDAEMQAIAADVGYSETAFLTAGTGRAYRVRFFSPLVEVAFCGHATVATAVALAHRDGPGEFRFTTNAGEVPVIVDDAMRATLTSVPSAVHPIEDLTALLAALRWTTIQLVWRESADTFHVRDPFPVGGVYEDPATGAAAAAFGAYLRALGQTGTIHLRQGDDLGRPGRLTVTTTPEDLRVRVSGTAVPIPG